MQTSTRAARLVVLVLLAVWLTGGRPAAAVPAPTGASARSLAGRLLVAAADMRDPRFAHTVIYMLSHDASGAMGLVINRPLGEIPLGRLLERFGGTRENVQGSLVAHWGGPVEPGKGFVLHTPDYRVEGTLVVKERVAFTASRKILDAMAANAGPRRHLFALGYAGWAPGQLEGELERGGWITASADEELLFDDDYASKWRRATARRLLDL